MMKLGSCSRAETRPFVDRLDAAASMNLISTIFKIQIQALTRPIPPDRLPIMTEPERNSSESVLMVLQKALGELRILMGEAMDRGAMEDAQLVLDIAARVEDIKKDLSANKVEGGVAGRGGNPLGEAISAVGQGAKPRVRRKPPSKSKYPKFRKDGSHLVKIGWSKKERKEYEHRASRDVVSLLAQRIGEHFGPDSMFKVEQIAPEKDPLQDRHGVRIPYYQVYLVLKWFTALGLLEKHGRNGYRFSGISMSDDSVRKAWESLG